MIVAYKRNYGMLLELEEKIWKRADRNYSFVRKWYYKVVLLTKPQTIWRILHSNYLQEFRKVEVNGCVNYHSTARFRKWNAAVQHYFEAVEVEIVQKILKQGIIVRLKE